MRFYTVLEISNLLNVNPETVRRWIREGKIGALQGVGKQGYKITDSHLSTFIASNPSMVTIEALNAINKPDNFESRKTISDYDSRSTGETEIERLNALRIKKLSEIQQLDDMLIKLKTRIIYEEENKNE